MPAVGNDKAMSVRESLEEVAQAWQDGRLANEVQAQLVFQHVSDALLHDEVGNEAERRALRQVRDVSVDGDTLSFTDAARIMLRVNLILKGIDLDEQLNLATDAMAAGVNLDAQDQPDFDAMAL